MSEESLDTLCTCVASNENAAIDDNEFKRAVLEMMCPTVYPSQQNLSLYSEDFTDAIYDGDAAVVPAAIPGPFPGTVATRVNYAASAINGRLRQTNGMRGLDGLPWTTGEKARLSLYIKRGNFQHLWFGDGSDTSWHGSSIDLDVSTIVGGAATTRADLEILDNGWIRATLEWVWIGSPAGRLYVNWASVSNPSSPDVSMATGNEYVYIYGLQVQDITTVNWSELYLATTDTKLTIP